MKHMFGHAKMSIMKRVKNDVVVLVVLVIVAGVFFFFHEKGAGPSQRVIVYQNGEKTAEYSLEKEQTITISCNEGGYNLLKINTDGVSVEDADCPDKICVKHRKISKGGESIICLPHKLVIELESDTTAELDAMTN